jgi:hypothetical protein
MSWTIDLERIARSEAQTIAATALMMARARESVAIERLHGGYVIALGDGPVREPGRGGRQGALG